MKNWHTNRKIGLPSVKALGNTNTDADVSADLCRAALRDLKIRPGDKVLELMPGPTRSVCSRGDQGAGTLDSRRGPSNATSLRSSSISRVLRPPNGASMTFPTPIRVTSP